MRRFLLWFIVCFCTLLVSCEKEPQVISVTGITLNSNSLSMVEGETAVLIATVSPKNADNQTVIWSSSDGLVASVSGGKISALKAGSATITAKTDDGGYTASCTVTVVARTIEVTSISLSKTELSLKEGDSETITATVKPDDAVDKTVTWSSSDNGVATVDGGKITAIKEGTSTITAKAGGVVATCLVTVRHDSTDDAIAFADPGIKVALVKAFDTNGDGELSYREAAAVTSIAGVFGKETNYSSFAEFQYFTGVTSIPFEMFLSWSLTSITIPNSVTSIDEAAFYSCARLASIIIPESVKSIGEAAFNGCISLTSVVVPDSVTNIGIAAFFDCKSLASVVLPDSLTCIEDYLFENCENLTSVSLPNCSTSIGSGAFRNCKSLHSVSIPDNVTSIGNGAFANCRSLSSIILPNSVTRIGNGAFRSCGFSSVSLPDLITNLENTVFQDCGNLTSVVFPEFLTTIGDSAFENCRSLSSIILPNPVTSIGNSAFKNCRNLSSVHLSDSLSVIEYEAFLDCQSLTSICLPDSMIQIGEGAFQDCSLTSITLPRSIKGLGGGSFRCANLTTATIYATNPPRISGWPFSSSCIVYVPAESVSAYKSEYYWSHFADRIEAIPE